MTSPYKVTPDILNQIIKLRQDNKTLREIANIVGLSPRSVRYWILKANEQGWNLSLDRRPHLIVPKPPTQQK